MDHRAMDVDEYLRKGEFFRGCLEAGTIDDFGGCRFCGVPAGTGGCLMCAQIAADDWACQDYMDSL